MQIIFFLVSSMSLLTTLTNMVDQQRKPTSYCLKNQSIGTIDKSIYTRSRTSISKEKAMILQKIFELNKFPDAEIRMKLQEITGLPARVIQVWFQNRRRENKMGVIKPRRLEQSTEDAVNTALGGSSYQEL